MNKKLLENLLAWKKAYISGVSLNHILDRSFNSRHAIIKRAIQAGYLIPIRRDLYLIGRLGKPLVNQFEIALILYGPSYVSFESALSFHGWIPEAVLTTTCASVKRSAEFNTPLGIFSYEHIPIQGFSYGIGQHRYEDITLFIASPMKAIADILYVRKRYWESLTDLMEDLRIEPESIKLADKELLADLIRDYPSARVRKKLLMLQNGV